MVVITVVMGDLVMGAGVGFLEVLLTSHNPDSEDDSVQESDQSLHG